MDMVDEIGSADNIEPWLDKVLSAKGKVMGMGHRVYKAKDPRAIVTEKMLDDLSKQKGDANLYEFLKKIESGFRARMETKGKPIYPNVDFFSGAVYTLLGIPRDLFTPIFAVARSAGWLAHVLEQRKDNRIYRPKSLYAGPEPRDYVPLAKRK
jgi:citrate synthase